MALYEHIYLARQDVSAQQVEELTTALTEVLSDGGGKVTKNEYWGLKSLSLPHQARTARRTTACSTSTRRPPPLPRWSARCASTKTSCAS